MMWTKKYFIFLWLPFLVHACGPAASHTKTADRNKEEIEAMIGPKEYSRLMALSPHAFEQSPERLRKHSGNYALTSLIIPEYIELNKVSMHEAANLHWQLGQIHAFNDQVPLAIIEMRKAVFENSPVHWTCYVNGTIAFLEKDREKLKASLDLLYMQDNQMNFEFLEKFIKYFDKSYADAYHAVY